MVGTSPAGRPIPGSQSVMPPTQSSASGSRTTSTPSGKSAAKGSDKVQSPSKTKAGTLSGGKNQAHAMNIAAQAARNLGGFVPNKIFIGGVPITCSEEQFRNYFEPFGAIAKVELHALRGFGYITYESVESVDACLEKYEDHYLSKKWVEVKRSIPRELIDAYEREQRRLHSEFAASEGKEPGVAHTESQPKVESSHSVPITTSSVWGPGASPASRRATAPTHVATNHGARETSSSGGGYGSVSRIAQLRDMGFSESVARRALAECAWDVNAALDKLLASGMMPGEEGGAEQQPPVEAPEEPFGGKSCLRAHAEESSVPAAAAAPASAAAGATSTEEAKAKQGRGVETPGSEDADVDGGANGFHPNLALTVASPAGQTSTRRAAAEVHEPAQDLFEEVSIPVSSVQPASDPVVDYADDGEDSTVRISDVKGAETDAAPAPSTRKRIERAMRSWTAEDSPQLSITNNEFVCVWVGTETDNGWIHAESLEDSSRAGWLPLCVLKKLPEGQRWMRAVQQWQAMDETQCSIGNGALAIVWVSSRTKEGWTYVEAEQDGVVKPGWLPVFCLSWSDE